MDRRCPCGKDDPVQGRSRPIASVIADSKNQSENGMERKMAKTGQADTFHLWVFSDAHVATDKAVSEAIRNGMEFMPPAGYPETLANALRQSEEGGKLGGPP